MRLHWAISIIFGFLLLNAILLEKLPNIIDNCSSSYFEPISKGVYIIFSPIANFNILNVHLNYPVLVVVDGKSMTEDQKSSLTKAWLSYDDFITIYADIP